MSPSKRERALELAIQTQDVILSDASSVSSILRRCLTVCQILGREDECDWVRLELNGYGKPNITVGELEKLLPDYRKIRVMYYDKYDRQIIFDHPELSKLVESYPLANPISELEKNAERGLKIYGAQAPLMRKNLNIPAVYCHVSPVFIQRIIDSVKNRALEFINQTIIELQFGNVLSDIFERSRRFVDSKLAKVCPDVLKSLVETYKDLSAIPDPHHCRKIAFACRDILQDFTDTIYKPEYLPAGETPPKKDQTKNKVRYILMAKLGSSKGKERRLIEVQIEYFGRLTDYINKHLHKHAAEEDAQRCVMYTYLIIGDILKLLET